MTPLNVALLSQHRNLASLLTAGSTIPPPLPALRRTASGQQQLPPLLRQQLLALVHRAALLSQLRQLGLGSGAETPPLPGLAPGPVARLESLLRSDTATASQVLTLVDELLEGAGTAGIPSAAGSGGAAGASGSGQRSRRRARRRQEEREAVAQQLVAAPAGVDWTLLERNRAALWHAEHGPSAFQRRLQRRRDAHRAAAMAPAAPAAQARVAEAAALEAAAVDVRGGEDEALPLPGSSEHALLLAGALLQQAQEQAQEEAPPPPPPQQHTPLQLGAGASTSGSQGPGSPSNASATAGTEQPDDEALAAAAAAAEAEAATCAGCSVAGSQAEGSLCPICLDLPADTALAPCGHRACLTCCGRLASYCASSSFGLPLAPPLCPLCRAAIESFQKAA